MERGPQTLQEAIVYFANPENCLKYMVAKRWPNGVTCPTCGSADVHFLAKQLRWECKQKHPKRQFSAKVGTIFEDSPIGLDKWLCAVWMVTSMKNGVSSWEIKRSLGVTQKTAWFMLHRIRLALQTTGGKLSGEVEVDETYIGGKARNMHKDRKKRVLDGKGGVQAALQRGGEIRLNVIRDSKRGTLLDNIDDNSERGSHVYTDELKAY